MTKSLNTRLTKSQCKTMPPEQVYQLYEKMRNDHEAMEEQLVDALAAHDAMELELKDAHGCLLETQQDECACRFDIDIYKDALSQVALHLIYKGVLTNEVR